MSTFFDTLQSILTITSHVIAAASVVTAVTPTPANDTKLAQVYRLIETAALLIGKAKDLPPK